MNLDFKRRGKCRHCGKVTYISARKKCKKCSSKRLLDNNLQLETKGGEFFEKWREGLQKAIS